MSSIKIFHHLINIFLSPVLGRFVKRCIETIGANGCIAPHLLNDVIDFIYGRSGISVPEYIIVEDCLFFLQASVSDRKVGCTFMRMRVKMQ